MKKSRIAVLAGLVAVIGLLFASGVYAWCNGGYGPCYGTSANVEAVKNFQKDTLGQRDELVTKRIELRNEYNKPVQDTNRIGELRKEIVDLQTKIHTTADKYGVTAGGYGMGRGMMAGTRGRGVMTGCSCPMQGW